MRRSTDVSKRNWLLSLRTVGKCGGSAISKVVEELIHNTLNADGWKVVKSRILRKETDMLASWKILNEFGFTTSDAQGGTFGSRGQAFASISDVSVVEIITKACGRANGYSKVMKGCKCLCLGIDDDMEDVGTTGNSFIIPQLHYIVKIAYHALRPC
ncbi:DNA mismatch repair protein MLH3, partial [Cucurbita argyrosperma subsp. argyrosperma]